MPDARSILRRPEWLSAGVVFGLLMLGSAHGGFVAYDIRPIWFAEHAFLHHQPVYQLRSDELPYNYPPSSLSLLLPLGLVPWGVAHVAWWGFEAVLLLAAVACAVILAGRSLTSRFAALTLAAACLAGPVTVAMHLYNVTLLAALIAGVSLLCAQRERWMWAGLMIGLGLAVKPLAITLLLLPILCRRYVAAALAVTVVVALNLAALPFVADAGELSRVVDAFVKGGGNNHYNVALLQAGIVLHAPAALILACRALLALLLLYAAIRLRRRGVVEVAGALFLMQLLCFGTTWSHYLVLLLFPAVSWITDRSLPPWGLASISLIAAAGWLLPQYVASSAAQTLGLLILAAAVVVVARSAGPGEPLELRSRSALPGPAGASRPVPSTGPDEYAEPPDEPS